MYASLFPVATLLALHAILPLARGDDTLAGARLPSVDRKTVPDTLLKPLQGDPLVPASGERLEGRQSSVIGGLLQIRQSCESGYGLCKNGGCCPLGDDCCPDHCCKPGYWCYDTGCCPTSKDGCAGNSCCSKGWNCCKGGGCCPPGEYCAVSNGKVGCCPDGEICSGTGGCVSAGYVPCSNEDDYCCPAGDTCYRDSNNAVKCRSPGGAPPPTTIPRPPTTSPAPPAPTPTNSKPAVIPRPVPSSSESSVSYQVTDPRFKFSPGWSSVTTGCTPTSRQTEKERESFTLNVTSATKIYLGLDLLNVKYNVYLNGLVTNLQTAVNGVAEVCAYKQVYLGSRMTDVNLTVVFIESIIASAGGGQSSGPRFQVNEVVAMDSITAAAGPGAASSGATSLKTSWFGAITVVLLAGLGFAL